MQNLDTISQATADVFRKADVIYVKNKLSPKPQKSVNALKKHIQSKNQGPIIHIYPRMELKQNYSNNTIEISRMYYDYDSENFKMYAKTAIPASSSVDKYIKAIDSLEKYEEPKTKKTFWGEVKELFNVIIGKE